MTENADPGSFRDPLSRVYLADGEVLRALGAEALEDFDALEATSFYADAVAAGRLVGTSRADDIDPASLGDGWEAVLRHDRVPFISYPYEWSFEMLRDAAKLQLELTAEALDEDLITKDATSFNVQFVGSRPTFIDLGSFETLRPDEPWYGYRQFCGLFLFPLMLQAYRDLPFQPWLRADVDGISPVDARNAMSFWDVVNPRKKGVWLHVAMHARSEQRYADTDRDVKADLKRAGFKKELIVGQNRGLRKVVDRLHWRQADSEWSGYSERGHYTDADLEEKTDFVRAVAGTGDRALVYDLGANDGHFSRVVAEHADHVVAVDGDPLVVDTLYRALRDEGNEKIVPLVMNLADPSPGLGWRSAERSSFVDRAEPDLVLALALVHHLAISANVPLDEVAAFLADFGAEVVVEFPDTDDGMVQRLLRNKREGLHADYRKDAFEAALARRFTIIDTKALSSGSRTLYHLRPST